MPKLFLLHRLSTFCSTTQSSKGRRARRPVCLQAADHSPISHCATCSSPPPTARSRPVSAWLAAPVRHAWRRRSFSSGLGSIASTLGRWSCARPPSRTAKLIRSLGETEKVSNFKLELLIDEADVRCLFSQSITTLPGFIVDREPRLSEASGLEYNRIKVQFKSSRFAFAGSARSSACVLDTT